MKRARWVGDPAVQDWTRVGRWKKRARCLRRGVEEILVVEEKRRRDRGAVATSCSRNEPASTALRQTRRHADPLLPSYGS